MILEQGLLRLIHPSVSLPEVDGLGPEAVLVRCLGCDGDWQRKVAYCRGLYPGVAAPGEAP